ncbi:hypothetical protein HPB51_029653 [Rhipicephalus microplus]|uniref:Uncharacterized protein n=1 Tax=Rhipicephalus microplus TaxID=6941 RepID=A0A9J6CUE4_RHIMP|nr:hypothetical protein HPB51_029653 [Rhipicephalus microplus]
MPLSYNIYRDFQAELQLNTIDETVHQRRVGRYPKSQAVSAVAALAHYHDSSLPQPEAPLAEVHPWFKAQKDGVDLKLSFWGRPKRAYPRHHQARKQAFQNFSPISRRRSTKRLKALALPDEVVSGKQVVVLEYPLHPSLPVLVIREGIPLQTTGQAFERRTRTCRRAFTTIATVTMTKTDAAAYISYRTGSPPGRVRPAFNKGHGYPVMAGDVWLLHVGRAPCFPSLTWLKGEEERPHLRTKDAWTLEAPFVFGITYPGRLGTRYDPQGCNAASRLSSSGRRRSSKARNTFRGS